MEILTSYHTEQLTENKWIIELARNVLVCLYGAYFASWFKVSVVNLPLKAYKSPKPELSVSIFKNPLCIIKWNDMPLWSKYPHKH